MSRTRRKYAHWVRWEPDFELELARGHVAIPIKMTFCNGRHGIDEVWGIDAKRMVKRIRVRAARRWTPED